MIIIIIFFLKLSTLTQGRGSSTVMRSCVEISLNNITFTYKKSFYQVQQAFQYFKKLCALILAPRSVELRNVLQFSCRKRAKIFLSFNLHIYKKHATSHLSI